MRCHLYIEISTYAMLRNNFPPCVTPKERLWVLEILVLNVLEIQNFGAKTLICQDHLPSWFSMCDKLIGAWVCDRWVEVDVRKNWELQITPCEKNKSYQSFPRNRWSTSGSPVSRQLIDGDPRHIMIHTSHLPQWISHCLYKGI